MHRSWIAATLVLALVVPAGLFLATSKRDGAPPHPHVIRPLATTSPGTSLPVASAKPAPPSSPAQSSPSPSSATLIFVRNGHVMRRDLLTGEEVNIANLHTGDVTASPTSSWTAYVTPTAPEEEGDFVQRPEMHFVDIGSGENIDVGKGFAPLWDPRGSQIAYLKPAESRRCDGETCIGSVRVMIAGPERRASPVAAPGHWHLLAWSGQRLLVSNDDHPGRAVSLSSDGSPSFAVPVAPSEIWDASPSGDRLLTVAPSNFKFVKLVDGHPTRQVESFPIDGELGDGAWNGSSGRIVAVLRKGGGRGVMALLSRQSGSTPIAGSDGAMGNVVWSGSGDQFAYVSIDPHSRSHLQAVLCQVITELRVRCRTVFSWSQGVSLLKLSVP
jgi:hypothetical protein